MSKKWWAAFMILALLATALWAYNIGSITYTKVSAQTCEENEQWNYQ